MALVGDLLTPFSNVRVALSSIRNVSQRVIKGVDVLVKKGSVLKSLARILGAIISDVNQ